MIFFLLSVLFLLFSVLSVFFSMLAIKCDGSPRCLHPVLRPRCLLPVILKRSMRFLAYDLGVHRFFITQRESLRLGCLRALQKGWGGGLGFGLTFALNEKSSEGESCLKGFNFRIEGLEFFQPLQAIRTRRGGRLCRMLRCPTSLRREGEWEVSSTKGVGSGIV